MGENLMQLPSYSRTFGLAPNTNKTCCDLNCHELCGNSGHHHSPCTRMMPPSTVLNRCMEPSSKASPCLVSTTICRK